MKTEGSFDMAPYSKLSKEKLMNLKSDLEKQFEEIKKKGMHLDMSRGKQIGRASCRERV